MEYKLHLYSVKKDPFIEKLHKVNKDNLSGELCRFYFSEDDLMKINDDGRLDVDIGFICFDNFAHKLLSIGKFNQYSEFISYIDRFTPFYSHKGAREILNRNSNCVLLGKVNLGELIKYLYGKISADYENNPDDMMVTRRKLFASNNKLAALTEKGILINAGDWESLYYNLIFIYKTFDFVHEELFLYYE